MPYPVSGQVAPNFFLVSVSDLASGWKSKKFHRYLSVSERFLLQGHSASLKDHFRTPSAATKASGNAFNVLQVACVIAPLLEAAARAGVLTKVGVKALSMEELSKLVPSEGPHACPDLQHGTLESVSVQKRKRVRC